MDNKTVTVEAREVHTYEGQTYQPGDRYAIDAQYADSVVAQGKAVRVDPPSAPVAPTPAPTFAHGHSGDADSGSTTKVTPLGVADFMGQPTPLKK
jgi:hypothetical protein